MRLLSPTAVIPVASAASAHPRTLDFSFRSLGGEAPR
jgi:hypothetical protein